MFRLDLVSITLTKFVLSSSYAPFKDSNTNHVGHENFFEVWKVQTCDMFLAFMVYPWPTWIYESCHEYQEYCHFTTLQNSDERKHLHDGIIIKLLMQFVNNSGDKTFSV